MSIAFSRPSIEDNPAEKLKTIKLTRYLLKDVDKLKHAMANIDSSIKVIEYIKNRMRSDKGFNKKIKSKIKEIHDIFRQDSI